MQTEDQWIKIVGKQLCPHPTAELLIIKAQTGRNLNWQRESVALKANAKSFTGKRARRNHDPNTLLPGVGIQKRKQGGPEQWPEGRDALCKTDRRLFGLLVRNWWRASALNLSAGDQFGPTRDAWCQWRCTEPARKRAPLPLPAFLYPPFLPSLHPFFPPSPSCPLFFHQISTYFVPGPILNQRLQESTECIVFNVKKLAS